MYQFGEKFDDLTKNFVLDQYPRNWIPSELRTLKPRLVEKYVRKNKGTIENRFNNIENFY